MLHKHRVITIIAGLVLTLATPVFASHAFEAQFDFKKPITVTGTVTKIEWKNPHPFVYLQGKDKRGSMAAWAVQMGPLAALTRHGWNRNTVKVGEQLMAEGWLAKNGSPTIGAASVTLSNGQELYGSSQYQRAESGAVATTGSMNKPGTMDKRK